MTLSLCKTSVHVLIRSSLGKCGVRRIWVHLGLSAAHVCARTSFSLACISCALSERSLLGATRSENEEEIKASMNSVCIWVGHSGHECSI